MATYLDAAQAIVNILNNNWNSANTDNLTPDIKKIFKQSKTDYDFNASTDYILIFSPSGVTEEIGIGNNTEEDVFDTITIDVRSKPKLPNTNDSHFNKVLAEVDRIMKTNKVNPVTGYDTLSSTQQWQDFNDRTRGIFRKVKTVELTSYCRDFV